MPDSFLKFVLEPLSKRLHKYVNTHPWLVGFTRYAIKVRSKVEPEDISTSMKKIRVRMQMQKILKQKKNHEKAKARHFTSIVVRIFELTAVGGVFIYKRRQLLDETINPMKKEIDECKEAIKKMVTAEQLEESKSTMTVSLREIITSELTKHKQEIKKDVDDIIEAKLISFLEKSEAKVNGKAKVDGE